MSVLLINAFSFGPHMFKLFFFPVLIPPNRHSTLSVQLNQSNFFFLQVFLPHFSLHTLKCSFTARPPLQGHQPDLAAYLHQTSFMALEPCQFLAQPIGNVPQLSAMGQCQLQGSGLCQKGLAGTGGTQARAA